MTAPQAFPDFTIIRHLADGGMTHLYVARNALKERVVLRTLQPQHIKNRSMRRSFMAGAQVLTRMRHPHIVRLLQAVNREGALPFMVLEYIEAANMRELILQRAALLRRYTLSSIRQMAQTLLFVHQQGYAHMDFKPENILLTETGRIVLLDFDLSVPLGSWRPWKWRPSGTPAYIAPEVFRLHPVDERADIYSFGITCYEMLRFHKPAEDVHTRDVLQGRHFPGSDTAARNNQAQISRKLGAVLSKCLAQSPAERYPSMSLVVKDLDALASNKERPARE